MYNTDLPNRAELPTTRQLVRSTLIALAAAIALLFTVVLPAEYGIDPTGIGRALGLAEMGEIKTQLAAEAEADRLKDAEREQELAPAPRSALDRVLAALWIGSAKAQTATRKDEVTFTLKPAQGIEIKLVMQNGAQASYTWTATDAVNYDLHGDGGGKETSYQKDRGVKSDQGVLKAAFDGNHGWFWRNRTSKDVTITLKTDGAYSAVKR